MEEQIKELQKNYQDHLKLTKEEEERQKQELEATKLSRMRICMRSHMPSQLNDLPSYKLNELMELVEQPEKYKTWQQKDEIINKKNEELKQAQEKIKELEKAKRERESHK